MIEDDPSKPPKARLKGHPPQSRPFEGKTDATRCRFEPS